MKTSVVKMASGIPDKHFFSQNLAAKLKFKLKTSPLTPISDQGRISPYNINTILQTSDENKEKYKLKDFKLIKDQILRTNIIRIIKQTVRRITNKISGVKGLIYSCSDIWISPSFSSCGLIPLCTCRTCKTTFLE